MTKKKNSLPDVHELYRALEAELTPTAWRTFEGTLGMFLEGGGRKQLRQVKTCSASTVSRLLNTVDIKPLEQFSELRDARNGTPHHSILRPAQCFALAPLAKKTLRLFVKYSRGCQASEPRIGFNLF
ncbi:hypothetical protein, partial [Deinococcus wulumuqiensis]